MIRFWISSTFLDSTDQECWIRFEYSLDFMNEIGGSNLEIGMSSGCIRWVSCRSFKNWIRICQIFPNFFSDPAAGSVLLKEDQIDFTHKNLYFITSFRSTNMKNQLRISLYAIINSLKFARVPLLRCSEQTAPHRKNSKELKNCIIPPK